MIKSDQEIGSRNGFDYLKATLSGALNQEARTRVDSLVQEVASLKDIEKLLFCLLLPVDGSGGNHSFVGSALGFNPDESDLSGNGLELSAMGVGLFSPGGASALHLSNQVEQSQAYTWIMSHLEEDPSTCLRKDEVYEDYRAYCDKHHMKTLNTADFGKVMKRAFPNVKPRRLGQRGQSRYCYGGMRKKTEVKPPYLPDLTDEALGLTAQNSLGRPSASPASSSGASGDASQRRLPSTSPLIRMLQTNESGTETSSWAEEASVRAVLGVRGSVISDVAHILLEYAQQVLGVQFHSLFHLAQHLVSYRYVNSRSRYAFSLIAHAANAHSTSCSPPPTAVLAEAIQKGISRSAFDRVGNGRQKSGSSDRSSFVKAEDEELSRTPTRLPLGSASPLPSTPTTMTVGGPGDNLRLTGVDRSSAVTDSRGFSTLSASSVTADITSAQLSACSTPQPSGAYRTFQSNFLTPQTQHTTSSASSVYSAAALVSPSLPHNFTPTAQTYSQLEQSSVVSSQATGALYPAYSQGTPSSLRHPLALAAAAAVAAHQQQQQQIQQQQSGFSQYPVASTISAYASPGATMSPSLSHISQLGVRTPPVAHKDKPTSFPTPTTPGSCPAANPTYPQMTPYLSPVGGNSVYSAHQQTSPYPGHQQPPAPLPPSAGARSPYTPIGNPALSASDPGHLKYKRGLPQPVEAPGAYEPSPRFHLGGQSPNKRSRYVSTNSSTSTSNSLSNECGATGTGTTGTDGSDSYIEPTQPPSLMGSSNLAVASPSSSGSSNRSVHHLSSVGYNTGSTIPGSTTEQHRTLASPYYSSRYEGLEMRSPAPHIHSQGSTHSTIDRRTRLPQLTAGASDSTGWSSNSITVNGTSGLSYGHAKSNNYLGELNYGSGMNTSVKDLPSTNTSVFRPPVTPFVLELEDDSDLNNLPRLGSSPGPQIPPSSPTEFLPFYSEAATKSAKQHQRCPPTGAGATPDMDDSTSSSSSDSPHLSTTDARRLLSSGAHLETPPPSALVISEPLCSGSPSSPTGSDNSHDRTLTNFEHFDQEVNTPPIPGGLAGAPSPSDNDDNNQLIRQREELQNELSTPGPTETTQSLVITPDPSTNVPRSGANDVSIPAF